GVALAARRLIRPAAQARTKAGALGRIAGFMKADVFGPRQPRIAGGTAIDAGGSDRVKKTVIGAVIASDEGGPARVITGCGGKRGFLYRCVHGTLRYMRLTIRNLAAIGSTRTPLLAFELPRLEHSQFQLRHFRQHAATPLRGEHQVHLDLLDVGHLLQASGNFRAQYVAHAARRRGQRHIDRNPFALDPARVDQAEIEQVDGNFRVVNGTQHFIDVLEPYDAWLSIVECQLQRGFAERIGVEAVDAIQPPFVL